MRNRKGSDKGKDAPSTLERILIKPVQCITDFIVDLKAPSQSQVPSNSSISLGDSPNLYRPIRIDEVNLDLETLARHVYILGQSGSGKTYLILLMLMSFVRLNCGFCVIDIHGDLSRKLLSFIAHHAKTTNQLNRLSDKLVLIEPFDSEYAPAFNPLSSTNPAKAYAEAYDMLGIFKKVWQDVSWGARMEELLRNLLLTLALTKRTLVEAPIFLTDETFRMSVVQKLTDQDIKFYWINRFGALSDKMKPVYIEPVLNKLTVFTSDPYIRHMLAQGETSIDFRKLMDSKKWVIVNISKGALSDNAYLLGSLMISKIKSAAMSRADTPEYRRVPFHLVVDEFQNFMGYNFEEILSEARKYKLSLILAHQNLAQIDKTMRESIFGNVATTFLFRLGHGDIREISNAFKESEHALLTHTLSILGIGEMVRREADGSFRKIRVRHIQNVVEDKPLIEKYRNIVRSKYYRKRTLIDRELLRIRDRSRPESASAVSKPSIGTKKPKDDDTAKIKEGIL